MPIDGDSHASFWTLIDRLTIAYKHQRPFSPRAEQVTVQLLSKIILLKQKPAGLGFGRDSNFFDDCSRNVLLRFGGVGRLAPRMELRSDIGSFLIVE